MLRGCATCHPSWHSQTCTGITSALRVTGSSHVHTRYTDYSVDTCTSRQQSWGTRYVNTVFWLPEQKAIHVNKANRARSVYGQDKIRGPNYQQSGMREQQKEQQQSLSRYYTRWYRKVPSGVKTNLPYTLTTVAANHLQTVTLKFFEAGHTFMAVDSVHCTLECVVWLKVRRGDNYNATNCVTNFGVSLIYP